ncbi:methyl-accepting chemotaxis protein [Marinomonas transparens]|uniref:Methyl-accepting chemotaxis protein n=1 Tax=Marinomonas transparens TaxID=2795388 RepID=A0A934JU20_9GAMM|nr:methyl-accepting chemotaxis protein [Marinomonas transparens]MBJ7539958.1 methyl-accepting chemotaxis protein [Marinomonas transparens]
MKDLPLKKKLSIAIAASVVSLLIVLFGIRLMGKVIDFAYLEREHIVAITNVSNELERNAPNRQFLIKSITYAQDQARQVLDSVFAVEKLLFHILGKGFLLDLAEEDLGRLDLLLDKLNSIRSETLAQADVTAIQQLMVWPVENSQVFGSKLREVGGFVKGLVIVLVVVIISAVIAIIRFIISTSIPPLEKTAEVTRSIAQGDLHIDLTDEHIEPSTADMVTGLRSMVSAINDVMVKLSSAAHSNANISEHTLEGVNRQQSEVGQLTHSIQEMSLSIQAVAAAAVEASEATRKGHTESSESINIVNDAVNSISQLAEEVKHSSEAIKKIEADSESILSVVDMINELTEQTNLLALNAAIEAARAGEQGRGFAVVADEVRSLAQRTQTSTGQIQDTIDKLLKSTSNAVSIMDNCCEIANTSVIKSNDAGQAIRNASEQMSNIMVLNEQISSAAEQQSSVTKDINNNTQTINSVAEEAAEGAKKTAKSSEDLSALISQMKHVVNRFNV